MRFVQGGDWGVWLRELVRYPFLLGREVVVVDASIMANRRVFTVGSRKSLRVVLAKTVTLARNLTGVGLGGGRFGADGVLTE